MGNKLNKLLDWIILIGAVATMVFFVSCTPEDDIILLEEPTLELDVRLPIDENGYYHLELVPSRLSNSNQTIHRITGKVLNTTEPTKVSWDSNLYWWLLKGETVANITKTYINYFTGELTYVNLPPLTNWEDALVPTINSSSYVGDGGEINTVIAPIFSMRTDTLEVKSTINEWNISQTIKIVLD
jgi:hypothetical protein